MLSGASGRAFGVENVVSAGGRARREAELKGEGKADQFAGKVKDAAEKLANKAKDLVKGR